MNNRIAIAAVVIFTVCAGVFIYYQILSVQEFKCEIGELPITETRKHETNIETEIKSDKSKDAPQKNVTDPRDKSPKMLLDEFNNQSANIVNKPIPRNDELLDTFPVEALRQQSKARGHWSLEYLPLFPPDDLEAAEIARAVYIQIDHFANVPHKRGAFSDDDHPHSEEFLQADKLLDKLNKESTELANKVNNDSSEGIIVDPASLARYNDLSRITLALMRERPEYWIGNDGPNKWSSEFDW